MQYSPRSVHTPRTRAGRAVTAPVRSPPSRGVTTRQVRRGSANVRRAHMRLPPPMVNGVGSEVVRGRVHTSITAAMQRAGASAFWPWATGALAGPTSWLMHELMVFGGAGPGLGGAASIGGGLTYQATLEHPEHYLGAAWRAGPMLGIEGVSANPVAWPTGLHRNIPRPPVWEELPDGWRENVAPDPVPAGGAIRVTREVNERNYGLSLSRATRLVDIYINETTSDQALIEPMPDMRPWVIPYSVSMPPEIRNLPLHPRARPRRNMRFRRGRLEIREVGVIVPRNGVPRVVLNPTPRLPRARREKEKKMAGRGAQAFAAKVAFWLWDNVQDVDDWVNIVVDAIPVVPEAVRKGTIVQKVEWLYRNPEILAAVRWDIVAIDLFGWAVDEKIGALIGVLSRRAGQSAGSPLYMGFGAGTWSPDAGPGLPSPGSWLTDALKRRLYDGG